MKNIMTNNSMKCLFKFDSSLLIYFLILKLIHLVLQLQTALLLRDLKDIRKIEFDKNMFLMIQNPSGMQ